jgi:DNA invertase Pin-like site-specific DNA recombinase
LISETKSATVRVEGNDMKGALYARVSTRDKGQDTQNQAVELRRYLTSKGIEFYEYVEQETATGKKRRPVFEQMISDALTGKFQILVIWALDRITREGPLKAMLMLDRLNRAGVKVKSLREPWLDPDSPTYELLLPIFAWVGKQEAVRISERVRAGLERAATKGHFPGRPRKQRERDKDAKEIQAMRANGDSYEEIASELGRSKSDVYRVCQTLGCAPGAI